MFLSLEDVYLLSVLQLTMTMTLPADSKWVVRVFDDVNWVKSYTPFDTKEEAAEYLFAELGIGQDEKWFHQHEGDRFIVDEKDGKLYNHWVYIEYNEFSQLFKDYDESKPHTLEELKKYLLDGNELVMNWSDRAPVSYSLVIRKKKVKKTAA